ncbi:MAG: peptidoglycan editing factor PgeF [Burkholderiaceae bacterium]|jgi:YfiH family protein|nr:peptidoglycan editing factor PgeF [Burkholderiaceae bacterium]
MHSTRFPAAAGTIWMTPDWPAPPQVRSVFTTRAGGFSKAPFDHLNLGDHVGDATAHVARNRALLAATLAARPVYLQQMHGVAVQTLEPSTRDGACADAAVTQTPALACTVMVADCLPVLFAHRALPVVAAAHAGWRGLAAGVLENTFARFFALAQSQSGSVRARRQEVAAQTLVWLGPCIGAAAFEVGAEVRAAFVARLAGAQSCFTALPQAQKYLADLPALARLCLAQMGIGQVFGNTGAADWCTLGNPARFFSFRRDQARLGGTGRMAACVWLRGP